MNALGNFDGDVDSWRIETEAGPMQGIRFYTVSIRSAGAYSGGETDGEWFEVADHRHNDRDAAPLLEQLLAEHEYKADAADVEVARLILSHIS